MPRWLSHQSPMLAESVGRGFDTALQRTIVRQVCASWWYRTCCLCFFSRYSGFLPPIHLFIQIKVQWGLRPYTLPE
jgi:hypothetical protein